MSELPGGDFGAQLRAFAEKVQKNRRTLAFNAGNAVRDSIQNGSALTAAPGQPVDTGFLKGSWQYIQESPDVALIATNVSYAPAIETGIRSDFDPAGVTGKYGVKGGQIGPALAPGSGGPHRKSTVGGHHSVALTRAAWSRIVDHEAAALGLGR